MKQGARSLWLLWFLVLPLAADPIRCAAPRAEAAETQFPPWFAIAEGKTPQGFAYLSGGVGSDERRLLEEKGAAYNVKLFFAAKGGPFLADVELVITDAKGGEIISAAAGPLFFIQLPEGRYQVKATFRNDTREIKTLAVEKGKTVRLTLIWDLGPQSPDV